MFLLNFASLNGPMYVLFALLQRFFEDVKQNTFFEYWELSADMENGCFNYLPTTGKQHII